MDDANDIGGTTGERVLYLLKTRGAQTAQVLASELTLTSMGARKQLLTLEEKGLLVSEERSEGIGRPARYWRLSDAGHARFPDRHSDLTLQLINNVRSVFGNDGLDRLIDAREKSSENLYLTRLSGIENPGERIVALARLRHEEGYMAEAQRQSDGSWLLLENHCPICAAATACQNFCRSELALFQRVLGAQVTVVREEHMLAGARRCAYRISPRVLD